MSDEKHGRRPIVHELVENFLRQLPADEWPYRAPPEVFKKRFREYLERLFSNPPPPENKTLCEKIDRVLSSTRGSIRNRAGGSARVRQRLTSPC